MPSPPAARPDRRAPALLVAALLATVAASARTLDGELQLDDTEGIERNPVVKDLGAAVRTLRPSAAGVGRPVVDLTFALNYRVGRLEPRNFHLTNLGIHLAAALLAWGFTRRVARLAGLPRAGWVAAAVAGAFALHPLQSQAVSYVSQRAESLASGLYLATVLLLLEAERRGRGPAGVAAYAAALLAFALGLGCKAIVLTAPAAWLLTAWVASGSPAARGELVRWRTRLALAAPFLALGAADALATLGALRGQADAGFDVPGVTPWTYLLTQARVVVRYLGLLLWPAGQRVEWDVAWSASFAEPAVLASGALLLALLAGAISLAIRSRGGEGAGAAAARVAALGGLWFFLVLSVSSSVVPLADAMFEHRVYLASWGVFAAAGALGERLAARLPAGRGWVAVAAVVAVLATWGVALHRRNAVWETREALWRDALAKSPDRPRPYLALGWALRRSGRVEEAVARYREGLARAARDPGVAVQLTGNLGAALVATARWGEAAEVLRQGLARTPGRPELLVNLGLALGELGDEAGAEASLREAARLAPENAWAWSALGVRRLVRREYGAALPLLERARALQPDFAEAHFDAGQALEGLGRRGEACAAWREAVSLGLGGYQAEGERLVRERCR